MMLVQKPNPWDQRIASSNSAYFQAFSNAANQREQATRIAAMKQMQDAEAARQLEAQRKSTELQLLLQGYTKGGPSASPYAGEVQNAAHNASRYVGQGAPPELQKPAPGSILNPLDNSTYTPPPIPVIPENVNKHYTYMSTGPGKGQVLSIPQEQQPELQSVNPEYDLYLGRELVRNGRPKPVGGGADSAWTLNYIDAKGNARSKKGRGDALYASAEQSVVESGGQVLVPGYTPPRPTDDMKQVNEFQKNITDAAKELAEISTYKTKGDPLSPETNDKFEQFMVKIGKDPDRRFDKDMLDEYAKHLNYTIQANTEARDRLRPPQSSAAPTPAPAPNYPEYDVTYDESTGGASGKIKTPGQKKPVPERQKKPVTPPPAESSSLFPDYNFNAPAENFGAFSQGTTQNFDRNAPLGMSPQRGKPSEKFPGYDTLRPDARDFIDRNGLLIF